MPNFDSSPAIFISTSTSAVIPCFPACLLISSASLRLSTECINLTLSIMYLTLFVCKCPIRCHLTSGPNGSYFSIISCTLFSPSSSSPHSTAALIFGTSTVFDTASRRTSFGLRPERLAASSILARISLIFSAIYL